MIQIDYNDHFFDFIVKLESYWTNIEAKILIIHWILKKILNTLNEYKLVSKYYWLVMK